MAPAASDTAHRRLRTKGAPEIQAALSMPT
jgi:hypothetical protein